MTDHGDFSWLRLLLAFATVIAMMAALAYVLKYIGTRGFVLPNQPAKIRRLRIVETLPVDTRRRLVIVNCDGREHLLLLNGAQDIVVAANLPSPVVSPQT
ncbi:MAG: flagellar biosynthetic protein FliO [Alphaproteobacteria bacterium]|nr:flagellar biosynthetic protein FliO [Alphaproteobacteria bacterium]